MRGVVLLLGGNLGDVAHTFEGVKRDLEREVGSVVRCSEQLRSEAWGFDSMPFLNEAVEVETRLEPLELLKTTQRIEERWGRAREEEREKKSESGERYCSRMIDIDIIFYGQEVIQTEPLTVPHPLMAQRRFVLEPLSQIVPHFVHPILGLSVVEMLKRVEE